jgi:hypothetical protein
MLMGSAPTERTLAYAVGSADNKYYVNYEAFPANP